MNDCNQLLQELEHVKKFKFLPTDKNTNAVRVREMKWIAQFLPTSPINQGSMAFEFGVYRGITINALAQARPDIHVFGFDSFEGLPEDWDTGEKYINKERFSTNGVMPKVENNVSLVKGWFKDTLKATQGHPCFINIDSDLYSSAIDILSMLNSNIDRGCIIRFDELCCWRSLFGEASPRNEANRVYYTTWPEHEWKALVEWLNRYNRRVMPIARNWFQSATFVVTQ